MLLEGSFGGILYGRNIFKSLKLITIKFDIVVIFDGRQRDQAKAHEGLLCS